MMIFTRMISIMVVAVILIVLGDIIFSHLLPR